MDSGKETAMAVHDGNDDVMCVDDVVNNTNNNKHIDNDLEDDE